MTKQSATTFVRGCRRLGHDTNFLMVQECPTTQGRLKGCMLICFGFARGTTVLFSSSGSRLGNGVGAVVRQGSSAASPTAQRSEKVRPRIEPHAGPGPCYICLLCTSTYSLSLSLSLSLSYLSFSLSPSVSHPL